MFRKAPLAVILFLLLMLGLSGCNSLPTCAPGNLPLPNLISPDWGGVFAIGSDNLSWEFPYTTCEPEGYIVELSIEPDFVDTSLNSTLTSPDTTWSPIPTLLQATKYYWQVSAYVGGTVGPASIPHYFYTEPVCALGSLVPPEPVSPADNSLYRDLNPVFEWTYPDPNCYPDGFYFRVSEDPNLSTFAIESDSPDHWSDDIAFGYPLEDCKTYYYQVTPYVAGTSGPQSEVFKFAIDTVDACVCDPADLPVPELIWPEPVWTGNYDIVSLNPTLEWNNPGPCTPDGYQVKLADLPDYADPSLDGVVMDGLVTTYTPPVPLQPARQYWWHVYSTFGGALSNNSNYAAFFTEPECRSEADLMPPDLILPANGTSIDTLRPMLHYEQPLTGCIPDNYLIEIQTAADFSGQNLLGQIAFPSTGTGPGQDLVDCTRHYWKVAGVQDGIPGPDSEVFWFYTNAAGNCPPPPVTGEAIMNVFCREGTYPEHWPDPKHIFMEGDKVLVLGRNYFSTYLLVAVPDETGEKPAEPLVKCWTLLDAVNLGAMIDISSLEVEIPPYTPTPEPHSDNSLPPCYNWLLPEECKAAGGTPGQQTATCICP